MTLYSTSWFVGKVYRLFAQMYATLRMFYGFWLRFCTAFAYVCGFCVCIWLLRMFLYGFCARCASFAYIYGFLCALSGFACLHGLSFVMLDADRLEGSYLAGALIVFFVQTVVISWQFLGSNIEGSVKLFFSASCSLILDCL